MRSRSASTTIAALCALVVLSLGVSATGCSLPWASSGSGDESAGAVNQAIYRLQSALGLADGAVTRSSQPPLLGGPEEAIRWVNGTADVDLKTGHIRAILIDPPGEETAAFTGEAPPEAAAPSAAQLDEEAERMVRLLGWDTASLETHGFTAGEGKTIEYDQVGSVYEKTWTGRDPEGMPNQGVIQVGLRAQDASLHSFLYAPGPETVLDMADLITKDQAIKTARAAAAKSAFLVVSTTTTTPPSTTGEEKKEEATTTQESTTATTATTVPPETATMVHTDDPGVTGGKDLLVWVVKLPADKAAGRMSATVYVDAIANKALLVLAT